MTATGWKRWAVISFCAFSFCCHKNHPFFPVVHQMYNTYEKRQQCDDRLEKQ